MVNIHYCMGNLSSVEYGLGDTETCGTCGMKEKKGCCHTEYKFLKLKDEHQLAKALVEFGQAPQLVLHHSDFGIHAAIDKNTLLELRYHSPPDQRENQVYLQNCVFRI
jgi:hypothetical protein